MWKYSILERIIRFTIGLGEWKGRRQFSVSKQTRKFLLTHKRRQKKHIVLSIACWNSRMYPVWLSLQSHMLLLSSWHLHLPTNTIAQSPNYCFLISLNIYSHTYLFAWAIPFFWILWILPGHFFYVYVCGYVYFHLWTGMDTRVEYCVLCILSQSYYLFYLTLFLEKICHWFWSLLALVFWLANDLQGSICQSFSYHWNCIRVSL